MCLAHLFVSTYLQYCLFQFLDATLILRFKLWWTSCSNLSWPDMNTYTHEYNLINELPNQARPLSVVPTFLGWCGRLHALLGPHHWRHFLCQPGHRCRPLRRLCRAYCPLLSPPNRSVTRMRSNIYFCVFFSPSNRWVMRLCTRLLSTALLLQTTKYWACAVKYFPLLPTPNRSVMCMCIKIFSTSSSSKEAVKYWACAVEYCPQLPPPSRPAMPHAHWNIFHCLLLQTGQ